jgi:hypothetical protein
MFFRDATAPVRSFGIGTWLILKIGDHYPAVELGYRHLPELGEGGRRASLTSKCSRRVIF